MRRYSAETFQFVHKSQVHHLCLAVVICLAPSLPLCLTQHFPQDGTCRLGGEESVVVWRVVVGRAELKNWARGGKRSRFGAVTSRVGQRGGLEDECVRAFLQPSIFSLPLSVGAPLCLRTCYRGRSTTGVQPSVPAARIIH